MDNDTHFSEEIDHLINGEIDQIEIDSTNFLNFREAWIHHPQKHDVVGHAGHHGKVTYYYEPQHDEND